MIKQNKASQPLSPIQSQILDEVVRLDVNGLVPRSKYFTRRFGWAKSTVAKAFKAFLDFGLVSTSAQRVQCVSQYSLTEDANTVLVASAPADKESRLSEAFAALNLADRQILLELWRSKLTGISASTRNLAANTSASDRQAANKALIRMRALGILKSTRAGQRHWARHLQPTPLGVSLIELLLNLGDDE